MGLQLIDDDDASRNAGSVKEVRREPDDPLDVTLKDKIAAYIRFRTAAKQNSLRQDARTLPRAVKRPNNVQQIGEVTSSRWRRTQLFEALGRVTNRIDPCVPATITKWRMCDYIVE